ncbi:MAG: DUF1573 domain-containing protein [Bacteroidota bacterium]
MKTALALLIIVFNSALGFCQVAEFSFEEKTTFKFPKTKEGEMLSHDYHFTNSGDAPLIISEYKVSCKCTKAIFPKDPIMPGESGKIRVEFDTKGKIAWQDRTVEIYSNAKKNPQKLRFKVMVENE